MIDCVGMEAAHGHGALHGGDRMKQANRMESDRGHALRDAILACRSGGIVDPSFVVTHRLDLDQASNAYETFKHKQDECVKVVLKP